jgi:hypothetical protein
VADNEIAGEIAEQRVFEGDPIEVIEVSTAGRHECRELTPLAKERQDLPPLIQDRVLSEPLAEFGHFLAAADGVEMVGLERFHP